MAPARVLKWNIV